MATGSNKPLGVRIEDEYHDRIEELQQQRGYDDRSEAVRDVMKAGLREEQGLLPGRARELALDGAYHLTLVSVTVIVIGFATGWLPAARGTEIALVLETVAVAPLAAIETFRLAAGQSSLTEVLEGRR